MFIDDFFIATKAEKQARTKPKAVKPKKKEGAKNGKREKR